MSRLRPEVGAVDHRQGPLDARIVLVEYGDFECTYCGAAYPELEAVKAALGDALCFVFRHFPLRQVHVHAQRAAEFAEAAATIGRFWEMHALLFENQMALSDSDLRNYAVVVGFDEALVASAMSGDFAQAVQRSFSSGVRSGVNGTPCLFINGQRREAPWDAARLIEELR